jgi:AraC family ethanolamine operon transcriptional activator
MPIRFEKLEDLQRAVSGTLLSVRQLSPLPVRGWAEHARAGDIFVSAGWASGSVETRGALSETLTTVAVTSSTGGTIRHFGRPSAAQAFVLFPRGHDHDAFYPGTTDYLTLSIDTEALLALADREGIGIDRRRLLVAASVALPQPLRDPAQRLHRTLGPAGSTAMAAELIDDLAEEALCTAIEQLAGGEAAAGQARAGRGYEPILALATAYIDAESESRLTVQELCEVCGVTRLRLNRVFRATLGMPPSAYMRLVRLNGARRDLLAKSPPELAKVTEVATKWGFDELGKFAGYYRRAFGERPSETLAMPQRARKSS